MHDRANSSDALAAVVRRRRLELGLHQDELAALAGVSTRFVHTLEQGKPTVQLDKVLAVLGQLGVDFVLEPGSGVVRKARSEMGGPNAATATATRQNC
jgi:HTH-type transcriptional regulator/antitoxin HipB